MLLATQFLRLSPKGSVTYRYCPRETSYGRSFEDPPPTHSPLETSRAFFDIYLADTCKQKGHDTQTKATIRKQKPRHKKKSHGTQTKATGTKAKVTAQKKKLTAQKQESRAQKQNGRHKRKK